MGGKCSETGDKLSGCTPHTRCNDALDYRHTICAENNNVPFFNYHIPIADKPDF